MKRNLRYKAIFSAGFLLRFCAVAAVGLTLTAAFPPHAYAFKVTGKILNGTTGRMEVGAIIEVINPEN